MWAVAESKWPHLVRSKWKVEGLKPELVLIVRDWNQLRGGWAVFFFFLNKIVKSSWCFLGGLLRPWGLRSSSWYDHWVLYGHGLQRVRLVWDKPRSGTKLTDGEQHSASWQGCWAWSPPSGFAVAVYLLHIIHAKSFIELKIISSIKPQKFLFVRAPLQWNLISSFPPMWDCWLKGNACQLMGWRAAVRVCKSNAFSHCGSETVFFLFFTTVFRRVLVISMEVARKQCFFYLFEAGGLSCP